MIVRVTFENDLTMLFGDSYKPWTLQFDEYCWRNKKQLGEIVSVDTSAEKWISWGGLKWCADESFQAQLNREGCQSGDPDNQNPRKYDEMKFGFDSKVSRVALRILEDCRNNRTDSNLIYRGKLPKGA